MTQEILINVDDMQLAALTWNDVNGVPVLALHGWLDNAATFTGLAPLLQSTRFIALDLPGHGNSDHQCGRLPYHLVDTVGIVLRAADALGWERFNLVGHSLGANIATIVAAVAPERITRLVVIEGLGPLTNPAQAAPDRLTKSISEQARGAGKRLPIYKDLAQAVAVREAVSEMNHSSVKTLVERNIKSVQSGVTWRTDPRLKLTSPFYMDESQVLAFLECIEAETLFVQAAQGFLNDRPAIKQRCEKVKNLTISHLPGQHHLHLDDPAPVAAVVSPFLRA